jgi:hypothetical protein
VRRVELEFDGQTIFALLHLPHQPVTGASIEGPVRARRGRMA